MALRLAYNERQSTFEELLDKDKSFSIHHQICKYLAHRCVKYILMFHQTL